MVRYGFSGLSGVDDGSVDSRLSALASVVSDNFAEISADITQLLLAEIPELRGEELLRRLLYVSVDENVTALLHRLELRAPVEKMAAPNAAADYARRLAQRDVSVIALVRAYRIGHARFLDWVLAELFKGDEDPKLVHAVTQRALQLSFAYIDRVSEQVVNAYQSERDRWLLTQTAVRASRVKRFLAREELDLDATEAALGYRLRQFHLAVIGWVPEATQAGQGLIRLDRLGQALAGDLGCVGRPLFVPVDESVAWLWLPFGERSEIDWGRLHAVVESTDTTIRAGVGELERGVEGFRASHYQAGTAQNVASIAQPPRRVTVAARVGPIALMCRDIDATRVWVQKMLGELAREKNNHRVLRDTLRVFLETGGSYLAAAESLNLHRNTVQYRLNKAAELLPAPINDRRFDLELALRACDQLGSVVLGGVEPE